MKNIDLDEVLNETRRTIRALSDIDIEDKFAELSILKIITEIEEKAMIMIDSDENIKPKKYIEVSNYNESKKMKFIIKVDNRLKSISIYENIIRPKVKKRIGSIYNKKIIDGRELLKFENEDFVDALYRSILFREVEKSGKINALKVLNNTEADKIDLIFSVVNSEEGRSKNVKVIGIKGRKIYLATKRALYGIPVLGYVIRLGVSFCLLPMRLGYFQNSIDEISKQVKLLNIQSQNIEHDLLNKIKDSIRTNEEDVSNFKNEINIIKSDISKFKIDVSESNIYMNDNLSRLNESANDFEQFKLDTIYLKNENMKRIDKEKELLDKFYLRYNEVLMPDSREEVKNRAKIYIEKLSKQFKDRNKEELVIVDLGCGECEWIELLCENGFNALGIDNNFSVVKKVQETLPKIKILEKDALGYLKSLKDNSVDILSSFHMVEHLEMIEIIELLSECRRVMKVGGMLIMETPNPQNILTSTYYFNMDPTHKKPIPPELLSFFISESGLSIKETVLLYPLNYTPYEYNANDPLKDIVFRFNMEQAYSVLAVKE